MGPSYCIERLRNRREYAGPDLTIRVLTNRIRVSRALAMRVLTTRGLLSEVAPSEDEPSGLGSP